MSTILKALRRLEEENSAQSQRPLREEVTRSPSSAKSRPILCHFRAPSLSWISTLYLVQLKCSGNTFCR